jgi:hypothetical protein
VLVAAWLLAPAGDLSLHAQDLTPWRQGVVQPKADAGFWWMAAEGGFARRAATSNGYGHALASREQTLALTRRIAKLATNDPTPEASYQEVIANRSLSPTLEIDIGKLQWLRDFLADNGRIGQEFEPGTMTDSAMRIRALARAKAAQ